MTDDDAITTALLALVRAYRARHAPAADATDDAASARYVLQQLQNPSGAAGLGASLDDKPGEIAIAPSVLIALIQSALGAKELERRLADSESEASKAWAAIGTVKAITASGRGTPAERSAQALRAVGALAKPHNKGTVNPKYREAADLYFNLRSGGLGGLVRIDGELKPIKPHSHADAVEIVKREFNIEWQSLQRVCRRHGITLKTRAAVFPVQAPKRRTN